MPELAFPPPQWSGKGWLLACAQSALLGLGTSGARLVWDTAIDQLLGEAAPQPQTQQSKQHDHEETRGGPSQHQDAEEPENHLFPCLPTNMQVAYSEWTSEGASSALPKPPRALGRDETLVPVDFLGLNPCTV